MSRETYNIMKNMFSGQSPIKRSNPQAGQSEYYYFKPNQEGWNSLSEVETVDVPTADTPNPFLQTPQNPPSSIPSSTMQTSINAVQPLGSRSNFLGQVDDFSILPEQATNDTNFVNNLQNSLGLQQNTPYEPDFSKPSSLEFDGSAVHWIQDGRRVMSYPAISGNVNNQSAQYTNLRDLGPIPEGEWLLKRGSGQDYNNAERMSWLQELNPKRNPRWYEKEDNWGKSRIPIQPQEGTNTYGRDSMYIHGGTTPGSAGCVDLGSNNDSFYRDFVKYNGDMPLTVKYPKGW